MIKKYLLPVFFILFLGLTLKGQTTAEPIEGTISFITSQNVYVKFLSTEGIAIGDTLFISHDGNKIPALIVKDLSSISCVCTSILKRQFAVSDKIITNSKISKTTKTIEKNEIANVPGIKPTDTIIDSSALKKEPVNALKQKISGRISVSSYSNVSNVSDFSQRMRYNLSLTAQNIGNSKLSGETYISFAHKLNEWSEVKANVFNGLKIYSLAFNYAFNKNNSLWVGRRINPQLSSVGAIDGIQYETKYKSLSAGIIAGTRPDYINYGFNSRLLQFGAYIGHDYNTKKGNIQSSMAFVEQKNNGLTDRRFAYFQHSNSLLTNLYFFGSLEFDLYNKKMNSQDSTLTQDNSPNLSNLYVSLRYKVIKQLSVSVSYSERQNIIYYETYKSIVEQLLESASMKGYTLQVNYNPFKNISVGANAGYRFSKQDTRPSKNLYTYLTYSNLPWLNASATISATLMEASYLKGSIYSLGISRDLIPGKLFGGLDYRYVTYNYFSSETPLKQNMAEMNLTWRVMKKLSCSINFEGTFEKNRNYERIYVNLTQRF